MIKITKNILLVEDNAIIAMDQKNQLNKRGYTIIHVINGEKSIKLVEAATQNIDLILMDIDLGKGIDGTQAAREILKIKEIPVVFLSSHTEPEIVEKTETITSYGYVVKNAGITVLDASIKMALKLFEAHKNLSRLDRAIENTKDIVLITDRFGLITFINPQFTKTYGYTQEETIGKLNPRILNAGIISNEEDNTFWEGLQDQTNFHAEFLNKSKNGKPITVEASIDPIFNNNGEIIEYVQIHRDITTQLLSKENETKKTNYLNFLNTISKEQANTSNFNDLTELITKQLEKITNPIFVSFSEYDSKEKTLNKMDVRAKQSNINAVIQVAGKKILKTKVPVDSDFYRKITSSQIRVLPSIYEIANGAVSKNVSYLIKTTLKAEEFWSLYYVIDNKLYGGSLFALKKGQVPPDKELLESFITISSISLRRLYLESEKNKIEQESKNYFDAINSMDLGLFIVNEDYSVRYMNDTMIKWFG
ncbi:MAG: PAS domain S-box protein, partial [Spirochaetales bacterium]|nr:PAS domain S-box protein [Spirochaetales bacterium]